MKSHLFRVILILVLTFTLTCETSNRSYAEPNNPQTTTPPDLNAPAANDNEPDDDPHLTNGPSASLDLPNSDHAIRTIDIYPTVGQTPKFYHTPILALMLNPHPLPKLPDISWKTPDTLWGVHPSSDDANITILTFRVLLSTTALEIPLMQALQAQDHSKDLDFQNINIQAYPIRTLSVKLIDPLATFENKEYGESQVMTLNGHTDFDYYVRIPVPTSKLGSLFKSFLDLVDGPELIWAYSYIDYQQKYATAEQLSQEDISKAIDNVISANQLDQDAPIFQDQAQAIQEQLTKVVRSTIRTNAPELIPIVKIDIDEILKPGIIDLTKPLDQTDQAALEQYIVPRLQKYQDETDHRQQTEHTISKTTKVALGASAGAPGTSANLDQTAIDELKNTDGVETKKSNSGDFLEPYRISVYRRQSDYQTIASDVVHEVFIASGFSSVTSMQSPLPVTFTDQAALITPESAVAYSGTSLGMSFCYFGTGLPPGYVYADGKSKWPDESWVPAQLRNHPILDMNDTVIAATNTPASVGTIAPGGQIPEEAFSQAFTSSPSNSQTIYVPAGTPRQAPPNWPVSSGWMVTDNVTTFPWPPNNTSSVAFGNYIMAVKQVDIPNAMGGTLTGKIGPFSLNSPTELPIRSLCRWVVRVH